MPAETHEICQLCLDNKFAEAREKALNLLDFSNSLFCDVNPIPVKQALNNMGFEVGACRLPLVEMSDANKEKLLKSMKAVGLVK